MITIRVHCIRIEPVANGQDTDYVAICSCGWESLSTPDKQRAMETMCAVFIAEFEGEVRQRRRVTAATA